MVPPNVTRATGGASRQALSGYPSRPRRECQRLLTAMAEERIGRYRVLEEIGSGGEAAVHRGLDPQTGQTVAIKVLSVESSRYPAFVSRFRLYGVKSPGLARRPSRRSVIPDAGLCVTPRMTGFEHILRPQMTRSTARRR